MWELNYVLFLLDIYAMQQKEKRKFLFHNNWFVLIPFMVWYFQFFYVVKNWIRFINKIGNLFKYTNIQSSNCKKILSYLFSRVIATALTMNYIHSCLVLYLSILYLYNIYYFCFKINYLHYRDITKHWQFNIVIKQKYIYVSMKQKCLISISLVVFILQMNMLVIMV